MRSIITIPDPCTENWDAMHPNQNGRHCDACALTVIDFTNWQLPDIAAYLKANTGTRVCGRFLNTQLNQPFDLKVFVPGVINWHTHSLRKIAALIIVCFALATTSCTNTADEKSKSEMKAEDSLLGDTTLAKPLPIVGALEVGSPPPVKDTITFKPPAQKIKKKPAGKPAEGIAMQPYTTMGAPMQETQRPQQIYRPKDTSKYKPKIGPSEEDATDGPPQ